MHPNITEIVEDGVQFKVMKFNIGNKELTESIEFPSNGYYKVIIITDNYVKTQYFKNGVETSKERIIQDERIKSLRR